MTHRPILILAVVAAAVAACDQAISPTVAGIGGTASDTGTKTAQLIISPSHLDLALGAAIQLTTNASPSLQSQLRWSSLEPSVAGVSTSGFVTAVGVGTAIIQARYVFDTTNVASTTINVTGTTTGTGTAGSP